MWSVTWIATWFFMLNVDLQTWAEHAAVLWLVVVYVVAIKGLTKLCHLVSVIHFASSTHWRGGSIIIFTPQTVR